MNHTLSMLAAAQTGRSGAKEGDKIARFENRTIGQDETETEVKLNCGVVALHH